METSCHRRLEEVDFSAEKLTDAEKGIGSIADSLVGIISDPGLTLAELREERLKKYTTADKLTIGGADIMEPVYYTVDSINGDYAYMTSDGGVENQVAMFLLPEGTDVGSRLLWENFEWTLVE